MPELPEVETTCLAIKPYAIEAVIEKVIIRHSQLRFPIPGELQHLAGRQIKMISRRGKYLLIQLSEGFLLIHLGMSGHLQIIVHRPAQKHDHIDLQLSTGVILRYHDPRRFGLWLYIADRPFEHPLLAHLGLEPLSPDFNGDYLFKRAQGKKQSIKSFIMNNAIVVGVGNIYATESLFLAGLNPLSASGSLSINHCQKLSAAIKQVLQQAITAGGTTLKDFYVLDGQPGYFANNLQIYGRKNQPCVNCASLIAITRIAGRNSAFCPICQPLIP